MIRLKNSFLKFIPHEYPTPRDARCNRLLPPAEKLAHGILVSPCLWRYCRRRFIWRLALGPDHRITGMVAAHPDAPEPRVPPPLPTPIYPPIPMLLFCPECWKRHVDQGEFATKHHHTHACQYCGHVWRPAIVATVGVQFLPGFRDNIKCPRTGGNCDDIRCNPTWCRAEEHYP